VGKSLEALRPTADDEEPILVTLRRYKQERVSQIRSLDLGEQRARDASDAEIN
jgi:hypothetical protein